MRGMLLAAVMATAFIATAASGQQPPADGGSPTAAPEAVDKEAEAAPAPVQPATYPTEQNCNDRLDNDKDGVIDCADDDCKAAPNCKPGQGPENTNEKCSDWVDNDGDGNVDCDDANCEGPAVTVCKGSWKGPPVGGDAAGAAAQGMEDVPELGEGQTIEDLIGKGGDKDGERNNVLCADGIDNDKDGRTDCADFGCRFDPSVNVCRGNPGMRFSIVAEVAHLYNIKNYRPTAPKMDTRVERLQLRSFGPIPMIDNSFYLISTRWEKTPRLTFAMFQLPLGGGHMLNVNSGGGGLSLAAVSGAGKSLLDEPAYYMTSAFQGGNGAAIEASGPVVSGLLAYRAYAAGGAGRFTGNVGGRYFTYDNTNYAWSVGGLMQLNVLGTFSQWDAARLYVPVPSTVAFILGGKYDQRASERFPAAHVEAIVRTGRFVAIAEGYMKWSHAKTRHNSEDVEFDYAPWAWNLSAGYLVWKKRLLLAADYGVFTADIADVKIGGKPTVINKSKLKDSDLRRQLNEDQLRFAAHVYVQRNIGMASAIYKMRRVENPESDNPNVEQLVKVEFQYRF